MSALASILLSVLMLSAVALALGGIVVIRRGTNRRQGVLMLVCALVLVGNVLIVAG
jgi:cyanate permease